MSDKSVNKPPHRLHGRRKGRTLRAHRAHLMQNLLPELRVPLPAGDAPLFPNDVFNQPVDEVWLEIGFGAGEHLAAQAAAHPTVGILGSEFFVNGVASLLRHIEDQELANIRIFDDDARALIGTIADATISRVFLLFPDPWPKTRHAGRRFISRANLDQLARILTDGGELRIATDDVIHLRWTLEAMSRRADFSWQARGANDWRERPDDWPQTRYEIKAIAQGRSCTYLRYLRESRV